MPDDRDQSQQRRHRTGQQEPHSASMSGRLNWLRAGVLGANDGIVSTAGLVVGVAGATSERAPILTAGLAGWAAGAVAMALGEYVSVSSQRDSEKALLSTERRELELDPDGELHELAAIYQAKGLSPATAMTVAEELTHHDAFTAHVEAELGIDADELTNPWHAAAASALAFTLGAIIPLAVILLAPPSLRVVITAVAVVIALAVTGAAGARLGGTHPLRPALRVAIGGAVALAVTYSIGLLVGGTIT